MKKIAFTGTHSTRKTTWSYKLIHELKKEKIKADYCEEVARRCPLPINEPAKTETQLWILGRQITEETEKSKNCEYLICDRSILDTYSYQMALLGREKSWEPFIEYYLKTYDLLIKTSPKEEIRKDKIRSTNKKFRLDVENALLENLERFKPNYIEFKGESTIEKIVKDILNNELK